MPNIKTSKGCIKFKQHLLFPGCHVIDRNIAFENLQLISEVLSKDSLFWQVCWGTLIGIVRDHDFIEWDEDIDIVILAEDENRFKELLWDFKERGFELIRHERGGLYSISRKGEYTDFYVIRKASNEIRYTIDGGYLLEEQIRDTIDIDFKGLKLSIPRNYDELLTFYYGDWRTPKQYYFTDMSFMKRLKVKLNYYSRLYLPDFMYYGIVKNHREKDLRKFVKKVEEHGINLKEVPEINL